MTNSSNTSKPNWLLCYSGCFKALYRAKTSLDSKDGTDAEALRSVIEVIWWISACNEVLHEDLPEWAPHLEDNVDLKDTLTALVWLRNKAIHQSTQWTLIERPFNWAHNKRIPRTDNPRFMKSDDANRKKYTQQIQGHKVIDVLEDTSNTIRDFTIKFNWTDMSKKTFK